MYTESVKVSLVWIFHIVEIVRFEVCSNNVHAFLAMSGTFSKWRENVP